MAKTIAALLIALTLTLNLRKTYRRKPAGAGEAGHASALDRSVVPRR